MRLPIAGKPVAALTARHERDLRLSKAADSIQGSVLWLMLRYRIRSWNRTLDRRRDGMPPPGTAIHLDAERLAPPARPVSGPGWAG